MLCNLPIAVLLPTILSLAVLSRCATNKSQGFIFPPVLDPSNPVVDGLTIHNGDAMVVEYTQLPHTTAVSINVACDPALETSVSGWGRPYNWVATGSCE